MFFKKKIVWSSDIGYIRKYLNPKWKNPNPTRNVNIPERVLYSYTEIPEYPKYPIQIRTGTRTPTPRVQDDLLGQEEEPSPLQ